MYRDAAVRTIANALGQKWPGPVLVDGGAHECCAAVLSAATALTLARPCSACHVCPCVCMHQHITPPP